MSLDSSAPPKHGSESITSGDSTEIDTRAVNPDAATRVEATGPATQAPGGRDVATAVTGAPAELAHMPSVASRSGTDLPLFDDGAKAREAAPRTKRIADREFGRYELLLRLGAGGMATLYLARLSGPELFEKQIAIKKIHEHLTEEDEFVKMFLDEARISALIHHPNVVQIFDMGRVDGTYFIAMEYVHGQDLAQVLRAVLRTRNEKYDWSYATRLVADAAAGLHAAHELTQADGSPLGLVHRDVSPQNILVAYNGHIKMVDFGVAFAASKISHTQTGTIKGKLSYMSPEQSRGEPVDRRTDVFALGIVLFETVCMRRLFREPTDAATLMRVNNADVPSPRSIRPEIPAELEAIILKALQRDPAQRYQSAEELQTALEQLLAKRGMVMGPSHVASLMDELFHERRLQRESQIQEVSQVSVVQQAIGVDEPSADDLSLSGVTDEIAPTPAREKRRSGRWLAFGLAGFGFLALIAAVVVLVFLLGRKPAERAAKKQAPAVQVDPPGTRAPRPVSSDVALTFFVTPSDAKLTLAGKEQSIGQGTIKRIIRVKRSESPLQIRAVAAGYHPKEGTVIPFRDRTITVELLKEGAGTPAVRPGTLRVESTSPRSRRRRRRRVSPRRHPPRRRAQTRPAAMRPRRRATGMRGGAGSDLEF